MHASTVEGLEVELFCLARLTLELAEGSEIGESVEVLWVCRQSPLV